MRDYAELVKELRCNGMDCGFCMQCTTAGKNCARRKAADAIEELVAAVPKWISVDERLPEIGEFVLVSDGWDIDTACRYKAFTIPDEIETFFWDSVIEVTHWMSLPAPPKEDADGD